MPVGGGLVISRQRLLDVIDRMRVAVPREVYDARDVLQRREQLLEAAQQEVAHLVEESKTEIEKRLEQTEVVKVAEERAREVLAQAQTRAQDLQADVYALQTLKRLEQELDGFMTTVRRGINALEQRAAERPG